MPTGPIIGIAGLIGAGKDTAAARLIERWGFRRLGFADALKDEVRQRFRRTLLAYWRLTETDVPPAPEAEQGVIDQLIATKPLVVRELLQEYGTEVRRADESEYWVDRWLDRARGFEGRRLVVPDMRFANEAMMVRSKPWGYCWKVVRPGVTTSTAHASEQGVAGWPDSTFDAVFTNSWGVDSLHASVDDWVRQHVQSWPA